MGVVSRRWVWVESMCVVVRRYIDFLISLVSALFCSIPAFVHLIFNNNYQCKMCPDF